MMLGLISVLAMNFVQEPPVTAAKQVGTAWTISPEKSMKWDGVEYTPIGLCLPGDVAQIRDAQAKGITSFVIDLSLDSLELPSVVQTLEAGGSKYFIRVSSPAPAAKVWVVEPGSYRQLMTDRRTFNLNLPGTEEALATLVNRRSIDVRWSERLKARDGNLSFEADARGLDQVMLLYPLQKSPVLPDFWDGWDQHRDNLLRTIQAAKLGRGFRGLINPVGSASLFPGEDLPSVPASEIFQLELEQLLQLRYGTIDKALESWALRANDIRSFKRLSRLFPLWSGRRGFGGFYDPKLDKIHIADSVRSKAWKDIQDAASETMHRRINRLVTALQSQFDAPVIQNFTGWQGPWARSSTALNGISIEFGRKSNEDASAKQGRAAGALAGWIKPGLMVAISDLPNQEGQRLPLERSIQEGMPLGVSGWFFKPGRPEDVAEVAAASAAAERLWAGHGTNVRLLPFPEAARGVVQPQALSSRVWWVPGPGTGERLFLEGGIEGYRYQWGSDRFIALWAAEPKRVRFKAADPRKLSFESIDGSLPDARVRGRNEIEVTLTRLPLLIRDPEEVPAPMDSFSQTAGRVQALVESFGSQVDVGGQASNVLSECLRGFNTQPGGSLVKLLDLLNVVGTRVAPYAWTEAELIAEHTFSDIDEEAGASRGRVLTGVSRLAPLEAGFNYGARIRQAGSHEVWVAGKFSPEALASMTMAVGGTAIQVDPRMTQAYGKDLAWYRIGAVDLQSGITQVKMNLTAPAGDLVMVDSILLSPRPFTPNGPIPPMAWVSEIKTQGRGSGGLPSTPPKPPASRPTP